MEFKQISYSQVTAAKAAAGLNLAAFAVYLRCFKALDMQEPPF